MMFKLKFNNNSQFPRTDSVKTLPLAAKSFYIKVYVLSPKLPKSELYFFNRETFFEKDRKLTLTIEQILTAGIFKQLNVFLSSPALRVCLGCVKVFV